MEVKVSGLLGMRDLALRSWADELFKLLMAKKDSQFVLDFSDIEFMSRSFAHEYLKEKHVFPKPIIEKNIAPAVKQMFDLASQFPKKKDVKIDRHITVNNLL
ncbi:MAG: hypothetical protein QW597_05080 [Thermoplasmataceae archaeon]